MERTVELTVAGRDTTDGDGVSLKRIISLPHVRKFDPFLMLDSFGTESSIQGPGFPWHPHRGIITISYMITGEIEHEDSLGNVGRIGAGGVQWMKAASGIVHKEMPRPSKNGIRGLQFWLNLGADDKMSDPDYGDIADSDIPSVSPVEGVTVDVIAGSLFSVTGPVKFTRTFPEMYVITMNPGSVISIPANFEKNFFVVGISGSPSIAGKTIDPHTANLLSTGTVVTLRASELSKCMIVGAVPLGEPIAWEGPIVMNSHEELAEAFHEFHTGTFVKVGTSPLADTIP